MVAAQGGGDLVCTLCRGASPAHACLAGEVSLRDAAGGTKSPGPAPASTGLAVPAACFADPLLGACGRAVKIAPAEPTVMAMLECYEPSRVAWRVLSRAAMKPRQLAMARSTGARARLPRIDPAMMMPEVDS